MQLARITCLLFAVIAPLLADSAAGSRWSPVPRAHAGGLLPGTPGVHVYSLQQIDANNDGRPDISVIDCAFASARDRVIVVDGGRNMVASDDWTVATDFSDDTWIFDVGSLGTARLIIRFRHEDGHDVAYLYDDQDGDGTVSYYIDRSDVIISESQYWSIKAVSSSSWLDDEGRLNPDLMFLSDGVEVDVTPWTDGSRPADGTIDAIIEEHPRRPGNLWYELKYVVSETRSDQAVMRSAIRVNESDNELSAPTGYVFFPFLGSAGWYRERYWFETPPTVMVNWGAGRITDVGLLGYPVRQGYYINGPYYFQKGRPNLIGFENPQALYRLAAPSDPLADPDLHIRMSYWAPYQPGANNGRIPFEQVSYDWRQRPDRGLTWDFKIDVAGTREITDVIAFPDFGIKMPPYESLPYWVTEGEWAYGTFVAVEQGPYVSSEGIYEWYTAEGMTPDLREVGDDPIARAAQHNYLLGKNPTSPERFYQVIRSGLRAEYADLHGRALLYFSPIDRRLHLLKARHGVWKVLGTNRELRYASLDGTHINRWSLVDLAAAEAAHTDPPDPVPGVTTSLYFASDQLLYADQTGVRIRSVDPNPVLFTTLPPRDRQEWERLGGLLEEHKGSFEGHDLRAMFDQFDGPVLELKSGSIFDFRLVEDGFRFALELPTGSASSVPWATALGPGAYVVHYRPGIGYSVEPLTPPDLELSPVVELNRPVTALRPAELSVHVRNRGSQDAHAVPIVISARSDNGEMVRIGSAFVDVPGGQMTEARIAWTVPLAGSWTVEAVAVDRASAPPNRVVVNAAPSTNLGDLLLAQQFGDGTLVAIAMMLLVAGTVSTALMLGAGSVPSRVDDE